MTSILISDWSRTPPRWRTRRCVRVTATRRPPPVTRDTCSQLVGELTSCMYLYSFYLISHFLFCPYVYFILPASDTQSSYSDYPSLSNDDHDPRYEHDNSAGTILTTLQTCKRCLTICVRRLRARAVRALGVPGVPPPDLGVEDGPEHEPRGAGAAVRPRQDPDPRPR